MDYFMFEIILDLPVTLLKRIKVVVEWEDWLKVLVILIFLGVNLALFYFFFLSIDGLIDSTERINRLSGFKDRKLIIDLDECTVERKWEPFEFISEFRNFIIITWNLSAHLEDRLLDFIEGFKLVWQWSHWIWYLFNVGCCSFFLRRNSDIELCQEVSKDLVKL